MENAAAPVKGSRRAPSVIACDKLVYQCFSQAIDLLDANTVRRNRLARCRARTYVSFVETAPWNRQELCDQPRYRGVGAVVLRAAIELSNEIGFKRRIGLHSLPQSNGFDANICGGILLRGTVGRTDLGERIDFDRRQRRGACVRL
ncbi:hypothetical protein [Bradyrhizobium macuxiense]|uniref:hypothetical protein n=1 Tax=Bradyrhizobium macuxiense TaxID=1755647 RepID=UPI0010A96A5F|nr:hypothetical protein [Bradyrhizobium macuxiense]